MILGETDADKLAALGSERQGCPGGGPRGGTHRSCPCLIGLARPPCKSAAGFPTAMLSWSPTAPLPPSNSSPPSATMSASLPACASTPICSIARRKSAKVAVGRRSRQSYSSHHAGPARIILHHHALGERSRKIAQAQTRVITLPGCNAVVAAAQESLDLIGRERPAKYVGRHSLSG